MKFRLLYVGEVKINPRKRASHVHDIRMALSQQLQNLLDIPPYSKIKNFIHAPDQNGSVKNILRKVDGIEFVPVISSELDLLAELEIQILHPELLGTARADIDNRTKTLLDALRRPQDAHEVPEGVHRGGRVYTLLDDDHLVTRLTVNTSHWLDATNPNDLFLMITVNIRASKGTQDNIDFVL